MEINWDEVAQEADDTPRSVLAEVLGQADDIDEIIILVHFKDGNQREWYVASDPVRLTMLTIAHAAVVETIRNRD